MAKLHQVAKLHKLNQVAKLHKLNQLHKLHELNQQAKLNQSNFLVGQFGRPIWWADSVCEKKVSGTINPTHTFFIPQHTVLEHAPSTLALNA